MLCSAAADSPSVVWLENNLPDVVFGALCNLIFHVSSLALAATSIVGRKKFLFVHQLECTAYRYRCCISLFRAFLVQLTAPTPHKIRRLLAVSPDMAYILAVVRLRETSLDFVHFYPECNMAKTRQFENLVGP
jgi:hypothetical protein